MTRQWFIVDASVDWPLVRRLPAETGILVLAEVNPADARKLRAIRRRRRSRVVIEAPRTAARVHDIRELRRALLARTPLILLSPIHPTASHPAWRPLPRMRAAALARLAGRRLVALGGMDSARFRRIERLGFQAWAGISAFRT